MTFFGARFAQLLFSLILSFIIVFTTQALENKSRNNNTVIMIGIDGLRANTFDTIAAPNMQMLAKSGVQRAMVPAMPTKTFVNFYSLATGLHPKHHGLISNYPYDRKIGRTFNRRTDVQDPKWWGGEPIWISAEKQGIKTATYFWVGSEVAIDGVQPSFWKPYNQQKDYTERVEEVLAWLAMPKKMRPQFITLYFSAIDSAAHTFGVNSKEEVNAVARVDKHIGELIAGLQKLGMYDNTNLILVSDHGMIDLSDDRVINIDQWADISTFIVPDWAPSRDTVFAPFLNIYGDARAIKEIAAQLKGKHPQMQVFRRDEFPSHYHFDHPDRGPDLMLLAEPGWSIFASKHKKPPEPRFSSGSFMATHGYDNRHTTMQAKFIASGPAFKPSNDNKSFDNIDVYSLIACILKIDPAINDGNIEHVNHLLHKPCD
ncbi:nucleotide pyrophosphatase/phosphodiesterase family protein [Glaciecola petra]|uniref:Alkaline phosphatase family protein n=1 Tax=Glaciecola petra TaxID=3075602 RepID=A0ABU2ZSP5_9ALTE|nr:alkaline phosphatase family protein [Aestuariibacter sp. P117]MDT0595058.1 alkaline phosphatase family protein [Aestuariibacter sp. P117]